MTYHLCTVCGVNKSLTMFYNWNSSHICKACHSRQVREHNARQREAQPKRVCDRCGKEKGLSYFAPGFATCRKCVSYDKMRQTHIAKREHRVIVEAEAGEKRCSRCLQTKPLADFNRNGYRNAGYRSECRDCQSVDRARQRARRAQRMQQEAAKPVAVAPVQRAHKVDINRPETPLTRMRICPACYRVFDSFWQFDLCARCDDALEAAA